MAIIDFLSKKVPLRAISRFGMLISTPQIGQVRGRSLQMGQELAVGVVGIAATLS
jgi:hypothetical protein